MGGFNAKTSNVQDAELYKASILEQISEYGIKLDEIKTALDEESKKIQGIETLNSKIKELNVIKCGLEDLIKDLNLKKEALNIPEMESQKASLTTEISGFYVLIDSLKVTLIDINKNIEIQKARLTSIEETILNKNNTLIELEYSIEIKQKQAEQDYTSTIDSLISEIASLEEKHNSLKNSISLADSVLTSKQKDLEQIDANIANGQILEDVYAKKQIELQENYDAKKALLDKELSDIESSILQKNADLDVREGNISLREKALESVQNKLRDIKTGLEEKLGVSIKLDI